MVHKGYISLIVLAAFIIGCVFISGCLDLMNGGDQTTVFTTYEDTENRVNIKYLNTWAKLENPSEDVLVTFMPDEDDVLQGMFNVSVLVGGSLDVEFKEMHIKILGDIFTDFNILYEESTTLADSKAYAVQYTYTYTYRNRNGKYIFNGQDIWTIDSDPNYLLTYHVDQTYYADYSDTFEKMIDSFEIVSR